MKKKLAMVAFTIVCTIAITISIASFTLGMDDSGASASSGGALGDIYDAYLTQVQHIIENSNLTDVGDDITHYHIVQIVDTLDAVDSAKKKLSDYLKNYIDNANDTTASTGIFRTNIIGPDMNTKHIDLQTFLASDPKLADAIRGADLVYIASNSSYTSGNDFAGGSTASDVLDALETYALSEFKPVLIDADVVGVTNRNIEIDNTHSTLIYDYLNFLRNRAGTTKDIGVASVKDKDWDTFFNEVGDATTYVSFNNIANSDWNNYYRDDPNFKFKVLEIVPNDASKTNPTEFQKMLEDKDGTFKKAFAKPGKLPDDYYEYECMTVTEFNNKITEAASAPGEKTKTQKLKDYMLKYHFIYVSHESSDKLYYYEDDAAKGITKNDFTEDAINALKAFVNTEAKDRCPEATIKDYVNRLIIDGKFFETYTYTNNNSTSSKVDTSTDIYKFALKLISEDAKTTLLKNVEITSSGFFGEMTEEKEKAVTDLINRSTYRNYSASSNGATFKVLEIEPYYNVDDTKWYATRQDDLTATLENATHQEIYEANNELKEGTSPFYRFNMTQARIAAATGLNINQIDVTSMSANALCSTAPNLVEDFDMIYIGNNHSSIRPVDYWTISAVLNNRTQFDVISLHPTDLKEFHFTKNPKENHPTNNCYVYPSYCHTGEFVQASDQGFMYANTVGSRKEASVARLNGSDITARVYAKLYEYVAAGMPLVVDEDVMDSDYLIGGASVNAKLVPDEDYVIDTSNSSINLNRYKLDETIDENAKISFTNNSGSSQTITYKATNYSDDTMTARKESSIDPESYMYQFLYQIAENKDSAIFHAKNVLAGFDATNTVKVPNLYLAGVTDDKEETLPDDIETTDNDKKSSLISELDKDAYNGANLVNVFDNTVDRTLTNAIDYANSGAGIQLKHFLNTNATSRPVINLVKAPVDYNSTRDMDKKKRVVNSKSPDFTFSISGVRGTSYTVKLYYDFDGDGEFSEDSVEGRLEGTEYDTEVVAERTYVVGTDGMVSFKAGEEGVGEYFEIDPDFVGVLPYKLVVTDDSGKKTGITGYPKYYTDTEENKQTLRLLEIIPGYANGNVGDVTSKITTLCAKESTLVNGDTGRKECNVGAQCDGDHVFGFNSASDSSDNLASRLDDEYDIELEIMTTLQFSEMADKYILDYCKNYDTYKTEDKLSEEAQSDFEAFMHKYYDAGNGKMTSEWTNMTSVDTVKTQTKVLDFNEMGIPDEIFRTWLTSGDPNKELKLDTKNGYNNKVQKFDAGYYDMVVIGFAKEMGKGTYNANDLTALACQFVRAYTENNGSILLGCDTTSYVDFSRTDSITWSRNINQYLRECFGMDRFKYTTKGKAVTKSTNTAEFYQYAKNINVPNGTQYLYVPYKTSDVEDPTGQVHPGEFWTSNTYNGTYEKMDDSVPAFSSGGCTDAVGYRLGTGINTGNNSPTIFKDVVLQNENQTTKIFPTTKVARNNVGLITNYPFNISAYPRISSTNGQSLALDTEDDDMRIWYTLAGASDSQGSELYAADPLNGRSFYYIYGYRSVTYTGAGFSAIAEAADNDEERKLLINAVLSNSKIHRAGPRVVFSKFSGETDSIFTPATASQPAVLECLAQDKRKCCFDFTVTTANTRTLTDVKMFVDENGNGKYDEDVDILIKDYGNKLENAKRQSIDGKDLNEEINSLMSSGSFEITVTAVDSDNKKGSAKLVVKTKSKLFNLN